MLVRPFITPENLPEHMAAEAPQRAVGIFLICISLWFTNAIPPAATGLLAIVLLPICGVMPQSDAFALFGNTAVFFMLGVFLLAGATISTGLSKRVTLVALQRYDKTPDSLVRGVTVSASFLSLWMPEHAVAAMIYPIAVEIVDSLGLKRGDPYAKKLFLGLAWGATVGGIGTFLGGARAPLALSLLQETHPGLSISFLQWAVAALPVVIIMTIIALVTINRQVKSDQRDIKAATRMLNQRVRLLGPMSAKEKRLAGLGIVTILAWITLGHDVGLSVIAILSAVMLFVLRIVDWRGVQDYVNWGVLVMYGGAIALGHALSETHALAFVVEQVLSEQTPRVLILLILMAAAIALTEGISNSAAVAMLLPIAFSLGELTGMDPITATLAVTIPAGLAFMFPISSPPLAISFSAGHYSVREMIQLGWRMNLLSYIVLCVVAFLWWGLVLQMKVW